MKPEVITDIPGMGTHGVINTGSEVLVLMGVCHSTAGFDYATIGEKGFSVRII